MLAHTPGASAYRRQCLWSMGILRGFPRVLCVADDTAFGRPLFACGKYVDGRGCG